MGGGIKFLLYLPVIHKVGDVRVVEKCHLTRVTVIAKSLPSGEEMANVSDNDKNECIYLTMYQALF